MKFAVGEVVFSTEQTIIGYLVEDISRLPIITNRAQELWLGIQIKAGPQLKEFIKPSSEKGVGQKRESPPAIQSQSLPASEPLCLKVVRAFGAEYSALVEAVSAMEQWEFNVDVSQWARELLAARQNVHGVHRSQLRRLLDRLDKNAQNLPESFPQKFYNTVELLALLPDAVASHLAQPAPSAEFDADALLLLAAEYSDDATYAKSVRERTRWAKQQLVSGYLRYALRFARNYAGEKVPLPDLIQHGFMGLMNAADRFDYTIRARFGAYAINWIWQNITRALADQGALVRLPVHIQERLSKFVKILAERDAGLDDPLDDLELLAESGFLKEEIIQSIRKATDEGKSLDDGVEKSLFAARRRVRRLLMQSYGMISLDEWLEEAPPSDDPDADPVALSLPEDSADGMSVDLKAAIERLLTPLKQREREVIDLRFGLNDGYDRTLEEVGNAFGVTRERARQIEAKVFKGIDHRMLGSSPPVTRDILSAEKWWSLPQPRLPAIDLIDSLLAARSDDEGDDFAWLDSFLNSLPQSALHPSRLGRTGTRGDRLAQALATLGAPAHYKVIAEQVNEAGQMRRPLDESSAYVAMQMNDKEFIPLGEGVFSLVEWEKARAAEPEPVLPLCPLALPDPPDFEAALFESVFVAHECLAQQPAAMDFVNHMLRWASADPATKLWARQGILSTYYILGLIPYTFIYDGANPRLHSTLPQADIQSLRRYCLETLTRRLAAMPEFWWLLRAAQPARPADLSEQWAELHPDSVDDALQRLYLLSSMGAAIRLPYGYYRLTSLGEACASDWAVSPDELEEVVVEMENEFAGSLLDWSLF